MHELEIDYINSLKETYSLNELEKRVNLNLCIFETGLMLAETDRENLLVT